MGRLLLCPRRLVRGLWEGLVTYGRLCIVGDTAPYEDAHPRALWRDPPPGHPERLRPDLPLTDLERRLARELTTDGQQDRKAA
ncbi:DUF6059 family protein [Streptomyces sp. AC627_RSS907]|uniref:DUF6059 family protein n=1 Tax=Streptomyces sp. AC627_RSS907 TaxID=2823684 RepID=UPI001C22EE6A|nr:DUF6059 family protein [Streptomyces sp. AC627_RSS907]